MESLNKLDKVYCREAKWTLENAFPMIRIHAIHAVFTYSKENFTDAFGYLAEIKDCRSTIKGLGRGEFGQMIPRHIDTFIKLKHKEKRFEITSERLCGERDTVALDPTQCDHKLLPAIEAVKTLVADTKRDYRDVPQVNNVDHVLCNKHSINFVSAMLHTQEEYVQSGEIRVAAAPAVVETNTSTNATAIWAVAGRRGHFWIRWLFFHFRLFSALWGYRVCVKVPEK